MILHGSMNQVTIKRATADVTGKMGLSFLWHAMEHAGVMGAIDKRLPKRGKTNREIEASEKVMAGVVSIINGGERIEDIEVLRKDQGFLNSIGRKSLISPDTLREFMKKKRHAGGIRKTIESMACQAMKKSPVESFTYDIDATYFDSEKDSAAYSYQEKRQYSGLLGFIAELGVCVTSSFRSGNVSPQTGIENQLRKAVQCTKASGKRIGSIRSDSAGHKNEIFAYCNAAGIKYYISLDKNAAIIDCIKAIPNRGWQKKECEERETWWAESVYVTNKLETVRILILRWKNPHPDLFEGTYRYHVIGTNDESIEPMKWLEFHNGRMNSENYNKELKDGLNAGYAPSHDFLMDQSYFLLNVLAYNVVQVLKFDYLSEKMRKATIKTLRLWFINVCGHIVRSARKYYCKILNVTDETFELFRHCLGRIKIVH